LKILFLCELFYPKGGGAEFASYLIAKELANAGHQVKVVTNLFVGESVTSILDGILVIRRPLLSNPSSVKFSMLLQGGSVRGKWLTDLINWSDIVYMPRYWYSAIPLVKRLGKPLIVHLHDYIPVCPVSNLFDSRSNQICMNDRCSSSCVYSYERRKGTNRINSNVSSVLNSTIGRYMGWMIRGSDAVICVSKAQRRLLVERAPALESKTSVIYNPLPDLKTIPMSGKGFAYFGGSSPMKGFHVIAQALPKIRNESFTLKAAGFRDSDKSGKELTDNRVNVLGWVSDKDLETVYSGTFAVLVPSIWAEPAPYVVYESVLRGRLLIGSRIGGITEQLEGYEGCMLVKPGDSSDLADKIESLLGLDLTEAQEYADSNRSKLVDYNANQRMLESFERLMSRLISAGN
jgi:glycosyltransferase involved in cell wall biosynthesis